MLRMGIKLRHIFGQRFSSETAFLEGLIVLTVVDDVALDIPARASRRFRIRRFIPSITYYFEFINNSYGLVVVDLLL